MPVSDDDYKRRLANRSTKRANTTVNPYATGFSYLGDYIKNEMNPFMGTAEEAKKDPRKALVLAMVGVAGAGGGKGKAVRLIDQIPTPVLQRAVQTAAMEGKRIGGGFVEDAAVQGVRFGQGGVSRAGRAAEDELFRIISEWERMGVTSQTATRGLKGFAKWADDPFEAMEGMGENMARTTKGFKEALVERMYRRIADAAEQGFM